MEAQNAALKDKLANTNAKSQTALTEEELAEREAIAKKKEEERSAKEAELAAQNAAHKEKIASTGAKSETSLTPEELAMREAKAAEIKVTLALALPRAFYGALPKSPLALDTIPPRSLQEAHDKEAARRAKENAELKEKLASTGAKSETALTEDEQAERDRLEREKAANKIADMQRKKKENAAMKERLSNTGSTLA